jgi:hypothetical protein
MRLLGPFTAHHFLPNLYWPNKLTRLEKLANNIHSNLLGLFVSYEENVIMLNVAIQNVAMQNVIMLNVIC